MKQKIVLKPQMHCDACRTKALKIAAQAEGVSSVAIEGKDKEQLVVVGEGIDSIELARKLRKKLGFADIVTVTEVKPAGNKDKDNKDNKDNKDKVKPIQACVQYFPPSGYPHQCQVVYDSYGTSSGCCMM